MRKLTLAVFILSFFARAAQAGIDFDYGGGFNLGGELVGLALSSPAPQVPVAAVPDKEWTIMVFINAKNDLEYYGLKDLNEMEMTGSGDKYNVVVELARAYGHDDSDDDWTGARRYLVQKDADAKNITSPVVEELPDADMGDYKHLADFAKWAKARYPARKYMLIVWNHGTGWMKSAKGPDRGISYDDETGHHINTPQLGLALKEMGGVDVYGSDACLMQMAEVVYELKDHAAYIAGSEETEPGDGYPYNVFLSALAARQTMAPDELAKAAVDAYSDHYKVRNIGSTHSYVRTSALNGFLAASNAFSRALIRFGDKELLGKVLGAAQNYAYWENRDLYHFAQLAAAGTGSAEVKKAAEALMAYISDELVGYNRTTNGAEGEWWSRDNYDNSHGVAVYLPAPVAPALPAYAELAWAKQSDWDDFIAWLVQP